MRFAFFDLLFAGFLAFFDFFAAPGFFAFRLPAAAGFAAADFFPSALPWTCRRWRRVADKVVWIAGMQTVVWLRVVKSFMAPARDSVTQLLAELKTTVKLLP